MANYEQSVSYLSPDDAATIVPLGENLAVSRSGDLLPIEWYVGGEKKFTTPVGPAWVTSVNPATLGYGTQWDEDTEYSWYIRYLSACDVKTWVTDHWEFSGNLVYTTLDTRTFTTCTIPKATVPTPTNGGTADFAYGTTIAHSFTRPSLDPEGEAVDPNVDVWFSAVGDDLVKIYSNRDASVFSRGFLSEGTSYQWRIDPIMTGWGTGTGIVWTYTINVSGPPDINKIYLGATGAFIVAMTDMGIYLSSDVGDTWARHLPDSTQDTNWLSGVCSKTGTYIIVEAGAGTIYRSANSGTAWAEITPAGSDTFTVNKMAISETGEFVLIVGLNATDASKSCYLSDDYGATWTAIYPAEASIEWEQCDISLDGTVLIVSNVGGDVYVSSDSGTTWVVQDIDSTSNTWDCLAVSGDGALKLIANTADVDEVFKNGSSYSVPTWAESTITDVGRALLDDTTQAAQQTTLGLGTTDSPTFAGLKISDGGTVGLAGGPLLVFNSAWPKLVLLNEDDGDSLRLKRTAGANSSSLGFGINETTGYCYIQSNRHGTGTVQPLRFYMGNDIGFEIDTDGDLDFQANDITTTGTVDGSAGKILVEDKDTVAPTSESDGYVGVAKIGGTARVYFAVDGIMYYIDGAAASVPVTGNPIGLLLALTYNLE